MIALYLIASHMVGDFLFQTRWQAEHKRSSRPYRTRHVASYTLAFVPGAFLLNWQHALAFLGALALLHYITDSHRFQSTLGDWIGWSALSPLRQQNAWRDELSDESDMLGPVDPLLMLSPPPNPWKPTPIMVDQTLHLVQLAILGAVFLR